MKVGISTASLFVRKTTEDALHFLSANGVKNAEVFLESFCEYNREFGKLLKSVQGDTKIHSIHVLTTQLEPQLYSIGERAQEDSFKILDGVLQAGNEIGAENYTFHGPARLKKTFSGIDFERVGKITQRIIDTCAEYGINLAYENVHWCYYNYVGFFTELRNRTHGLKGTLDIKQARQSEVDFKELIKDMKSDIVTVHLSDIDEKGKMCLPGKGKTDFETLFKLLGDVDFDGAFLIEAYQNDYGSEYELIDSMNYIKDLAKKVFNKTIY